MISLTDKAQQILVEEIAKTLYHTNSGMTDSDYEAFTGKARVHWELIPEWERDEYRFQAIEVVKLLEEMAK